MLPAEVPTTICGLNPASSSTAITPTWAKPRAAPPPSAKPIFNGFLTGGSEAVVDGGARILPTGVEQPTKVKTEDKNKVMRIIRVCIKIKSSKLLNALNANSHV